MNLLMDLARVAWLISVIAVTVWVPAAAAAGALRPPAVTAVTLALTTVWLLVAAVSILGPLGLLNPLTLALTYACWPLAMWMVAHRARLGSDLQAAARAAALATVRWFEQPEPRLRLPRPGLPFDARRILQRLDLLFAAAVAALLAPDIIAALSNTRLASPAAYSDLVAVEQMLHGESGWKPPDVAVNLSAALALVSAIAPVHVIRLVPPLIAAAFAAVVMLIVRRITGLRTVAMLSGILAAALLPDRTAPMTAQLSWVAAAAAFYSWYSFLVGGRIQRWTAIMATALAAIMAPAVLGGVALGVAALWLVPERWRSHNPLHPFSYHDAGLRALVAVAAIIVLVVVPRDAAARYVEYDAAARQTLAIANSLPRYRWMIVAPVEEWALTYGRGWHVNLHDFVADVGPRAGDAAYRLPYEVDELFVFVEMRPFAMFAAEPHEVPFAQLGDPVFRHYRSPAGRASLQFAAHVICERLRQSGHSGTITYDDGHLRIYRFTLR